MRRTIDQLLSYTLITLMAVMVLNVLWQVFSRYALNNPSGFTDELAGFLMIWVGLLGAAYATGKSLHLAIDIIHEKGNELVKKRLDLIIQLLVSLFGLLVLVVGGGRLVYLTLILEQNSANLNIPVGYVYLVLPLSGLLIIYYSLNNLMRAHD